MPLLLQTSLRYLLRHPWQTWLCMVGVALGVAMVVSIDLATTSANRAFRLSTEAITGSATHQIVGGPTGFNEDIYRQLRVDLGLRPSAPIVEGYVSSPALADITLQLIGVDVFAEAPFRSYLQSFQTNVSAAPDRTGDTGDTGDTMDITTLVVQPATVLLAEQTAARYGLAPGDTFPLVVDSQQHTVQVFGLLRSNDELAAARSNLLIADIATAQELLGNVGRLSRIDLILPDDPAAAAQEIARIEAMLPAGLQITQPDQRTDTLQQMTSAFELNLAALSLLALIVGMFLIYNTITFSIVQRRESLGTLRCLGVTRRQVLALVLLEALLISIIGAVLGLGLGVLLGHGLVGLVARTINDLYFALNVSQLTVDPLVLLKGAALGIGATVAAALLPAREAMQTAPRTVQRRSTLEERTRQAIPWASLGSSGLLVGGALLLLLAEPAPWNPLLQPWILADPRLAIGSAFVALFLIMLGCALLTPGITLLLMTGLRPLLGRVGGLLGRMAARNVQATLSRTSIAIAALMVAISVSVGVGTMVGSFRQTIITWLEQALVADIYVAPPRSVAARSGGTLPPETIETLTQQPGVAAWALLRTRPLELASIAGGTITLVAFDDTQASGRYQPVLKNRLPGLSAADALDTLDEGAVFISEPLAYRLQVGPGDSLRLPTDRGPREFPITAVYYDYTSDRGTVRMTFDTYHAFWDDRAVSSLSLFVEPGADVLTVRDQVREQVPADQRISVTSNRSLREGTLVVFDRTFAITGVLQMLATVVAFIGVLSALMALQLERSRELALLRATGLTPRQVWGVVLTETSLMGLVAGVLAVPVGLVVALLLILVINRRSFGWTLTFAPDGALLVQAVLLALLAALLAGIYPAWRMSRTNPALALREE